MRLKNQRIAKFLQQRGFEFWDDMCIADYSAFNGHTITFIKDLENTEMQNARLHFDWHWLDEQHIYWTGTLFGTFDFMPDDRTYHPRANFEVMGITNQTLGNLPEYENTIRRSLESVNIWSFIKLPDRRWKILMEDVS